jgi:hypothetical protein
VRHIDDDAQVLEWMQRLERHHEAHLPARELGLPESRWYEWHEAQDLRGRPVKRRTARLVHTREVSLLADDTQARRLQLPQLAAGDPRPFEVVGIGLTEPGYHVVEIESQRLGASLLARPAPMYVRTGVLVTNLGVHLKHGRQSSAVWVTTLDRAQPVAGATVTVHDCLACSGAAAPMLQGWRASGNRWPWAGSAVPPRTAFSSPHATRVPMDAGSSVSSSATGPAASSPGAFP